MPGQALSSTESKLLTRWGKPSKVDHFLRSIEIVPIDESIESSGLRGVRRAKLEFNFPVTVLVGPNGAGKSTFLCLAALAMNGDAENRDGAGPYRFPDFFYAVRNETQPTNFQITWTIRNGDTEKSTVMRRTSTRKWMDYDRRYKSGVLHIGLNRIASYAESAGHKRAFNAGTAPLSAKHSEWVHASMARIFTKRYTESRDLKMGKYSIPVLNLGDDKSYSGFNMGTGESAVLSILAQIAMMPRGSLILIEEIELAVHPSAQRKLAELLLERALDQNLQIICTSHSRWFIDALPREARIMIQPSSEDSHICLPNITTRMAEGVLTQEIVEELMVVCEDEVAKEIILALLPASVRSRIRVVPAGAKTELVTAAYYFKITNPKLPILIVWDSDVDAKDIRSAAKKASNGEGIKGLTKIGWCRLGPASLMESTYVHGIDNAPEKEISRTLSADPLALLSLAESFGTSDVEVSEWLQSALIGSKDHHSFFYEVGKSASLSIEAVRRPICLEYAKVLTRTDGEKNPVVEMVSSLLAGNPMTFNLPVASGEAKDGSDDADKELASNK
ncbi:ATP-dependent nuclease [Glutamicibacter soli]